MTEVKKITDFKPALIFLGKFLGIYFAGSLLYAGYVTAYNPMPDPATVWVTEHTAFFMRAAGHPTSTAIHPRKATTLLIENNHTVLSVFEGCNGLNVVIIFVGFVIAFGPYSKKMIWFCLAGIAAIHLFNLLRIGGLYLIVLYAPDFLYFTHKYLFTVFIYCIVFLLWVVWVKKFSRQTTHDQ